MVETKRKDKPSALARLVERSNLIFIVSLLVGGIVVCAVLFSVLSFIGHGIEATKGPAPTFWDCLYFSVVTISSLGYGDFRPVGAGRIVATFEVIYGLIVIALFVAKLVSERQVALIRLIYSSDHERRIKEFRADLSNREIALDNAAKDHSHKEIKHLGKRTVALLSGLHSYLNYQTQVGMLIELGGKGNLRGLLKCLLSLMDRISWIARRLPESRDDVRNVLEKAINRGDGIAIFFAKNVGDSEAVRLCDCIRGVNNKYTKHMEKQIAQPGRPLPKGYTEITPTILERVQAQLPDEPWPKDIHKTIASNLGLSNRLAQRAIYALIEKK